MRRLVYFSPIPWEGLFQRPQHTVRALSGRFEVLWVEARMLSVPGPPEPRENLDFLRLPALPFNARHGMIRRAARLAGGMAPLRAALARRQAKMLRSRLDGDEPPLLFFAHPQFHALRRFFPDSPLAYDHMDDVLAFGDPPPSLRRGLEDIVSRAQLVSVTAARLEHAMRGMGARRVLRVGNGVEWDRFSVADKLPIPAGLGSMPRPRVLYLGSVAEWFDFDLFFETARRLPKMSFPVVGPLRPDVEARAAEAPPNVRFFGARPYHEVPAWMAHSDLGTVPFQRNELTAAVDPVKLYEYLAAGLPVVATPFSPEVIGAGDAVYLAEDGAAFAKSVEALLEDPPSAAAVRKLAAGRRWEDLLAPLVDALAGL